MTDLVGAGVAAELERITLEVYRRGAELCERRGIIVADTKIELGFAANGGLVLADEVLTPDSSRFWRADQWVPGRTQTPLDKQYVRNWLTSPESGWDRHGGHDRRPRCPNPWSSAPVIRTCGPTRASQDGAGAGRHRTLNPEPPDTYRCCSSTLRNIIVMVWGAWERWNTGRH